MHPRLRLWQFPLLRENILDHRLVVSVLSQRQHMQVKESVAKATPA